MKRILINSLLCVALTNYASAQNIVIQNIKDNKSVVKISNGTELDITFDNYFRAETNNSFDLVNYRVCSENSGNNFIGQ